MLLGLPVACQLLTVGIMFYSYGRIDELAEKEMRAKRAIAIGLQIRTTMEKSILVMAGQSLTGAGVSPTDSQRLAIERDFKTLRTLSANEPKALDLLKKWQIHAKQFMELWEELASAHQPSQGDKLYFSQFLGKSEFNESLIASFNRICDDTDNLVAIYTPIAQEFHPKAVKARANLNAAIIAALGFNILFVAVMAFILNKNMLSRLQVLMANMKAFSKGKTPTAILSGNDELSDLDKAFREMSDELAKFEEIRQSMRAMVTHDLRSPLTSMVLKLELMMTSGLADDLSPKMLKDLKILRSETERLKRLANTLLDIDKMEDGNVELKRFTTSCDEMVEVSVEAVLLQCSRKKIEIKQTLPEECAFYCDKERTIQVIINYLSNAVKFAPKNSNIEVLIHQSELRPDFWRLEILDEGPGVPKEKRDKLFAKFVQLDQPDEVKKEGSGLGLYICKMLIEAQQGSVGFYARQNGGSSFWFEIPKGEDSPGASVESSKEEAFEAPAS